LQTAFRPSDYIHFPTPIDADLRVIIAKIKEFGFEGIVAKRKDSLYLPGKRPRTWVKKKLKQSDEFVVAGYVPRLNDVDEIAVGRFAGKQFMFVAMVKNGLMPASRRASFRRSVDRKPKRVRS